MDNQPQYVPRDPNVTNSPGQTTTRDISQQPGEPPIAPVPQPVVDIGQPNMVPMTPLPTAAPLNTPPPASHKSRLPQVIIVVILVILVGLAAFIYYNKTSTKPKNQSNTTQQQHQNDTTNSTTSDVGNEQSIPFGKTATDGSFTVKLLGVTPNPTVTGTPADSGTEYLEADFSVTSIPNQNNYAFNIQYMPSIVPSGDKLGDIILTPVDSTLPTSPITFNATSTRTVQIPDKTSVEATGAIPTDGSAKTVTVYALFEIQKGDKGQITWQGVNQTVYNFQYSS
ncbi:MAG TPA: hypothetical protein VMB52_05440 [Verrucomicrobiae bacterium]|nr:hypothetical protein [Verrucomicrobiae bacterium]